MIYEVSPLHREVPTQNCCSRGNDAVPALGRVLGWISSSDCGYKVKWTLRSDYLQPLCLASHFYLSWKTLIYLHLDAIKRSSVPGEANQELW